MVGRATSDGSRGFYDSLSGTGARQAGGARSRLWLGLLCIAMVAVALGAAACSLAYSLGRGSTRIRPVTVRPGIAFTNATHQTPVLVGGERGGYNVPRGVAWVNAQSSLVDEFESPPCIRPGRRARITFGTTTVPVGGPDGPQIPAVAWVKCG
jgi:hypothetical protein